MVVTLLNSVEQFCKLFIGDHIVIPLTMQNAHDLLCGLVARAKLFRITNLKASKDGGYSAQCPAQADGLRIMVQRGSKKAALLFPRNHVKTKPPSFNT
jgi:hypothetical protein